MTNPLYIRGINATIYLLKNFIHISFYFPKINNNSKSVLAEISKKIHLVKRLKAKMLVGNDILVSEGFFPRLIE